MKDIREKKVQNVEDYVKQTKERIKSLKDDTEVANLWFRGENKVDILTPLVPKIFRIYNDHEIEQAFEYAKAIENNFRSEFIIRSTPYFQKNNIQKGKWNSYFLMQHYGLGTRLLDWTESALIALYFAIEDLSIEEDCKVWMLSPNRLNKFTISQIDPGKEIETLINPADTEPMDLFDGLNRMNLNELARIYLDLDFDSKKGTKNRNFYPLALYPTILNDRMNAQSSCFTIFGNVINGLLSNDNRHYFLQSILIDGTKRKQLKEELRWLGISQKSIYPDLAGLSKSILDKYNVDHWVAKRIKDKPYLPGEFL